MAGHEQVVVYGDYDVDGVSGSAVLYLALSSSGRPGRELYTGQDDRGLRTERGSAAEDQDQPVQAWSSPLIAASVPSRKPRRHAALGLDLIITDHHEIASSGRSASGVERPDPSRRFIYPASLAARPRGVSVRVREQVSGLTGVGVAFKLAQALLGLDAGDDIDEGLPGPRDPWHGGRRRQDRGREPRPGQARSRAAVARERTRTAGRSPH